MPIGQVKMGRAGPTRPIDDPYFLPLKYQTKGDGGLQLQKSEEPTNLILKDHFVKTWAALLTSLGTHLKEKLRSNFDTIYFIEIKNLLLKTRLIKIKIN